MRLVGRMSREAVANLLENAIAAREGLFDAAHETALRLFNGFFEGEPGLAIDLYASTAVFHDYADVPEQGRQLVEEAASVLRTRLPWLRAGVVKVRQGKTPLEKRGRMLFGGSPDTRICEHGVRYAVNLRMNRDASFYLDTRNLRAWAIGSMRGKTVLNTFAYTGSLGVAAIAGGAAGVVQLDLNRRFLEMARASLVLNGLPEDSTRLLEGDFWSQISRLKRSGTRFDCVFLDPPFFASTPKGVVDLARNSPRLINKVRPLINDGGHLVSVNNALFVSGRDYMESVEALCADGCLSIEEIIPVPDDFIAYPATRVRGPVTDPAPFNHATKIAVLRVRRKDH